jgi:hypothetical protein
MRLPAYPPNSPNVGGPVIAFSANATGAPSRLLHSFCTVYSAPSALQEKDRPGGERKLDGKQEAFLVALACSAPPAGRAKWSMQLLADHLVTLGVVDALSDETVRRRLKETNCSRGDRNAGASPR